MQIGKESWKINTGIIEHITVSQRIHITSVCDLSSHRGKHCFTSATLDLIYHMTRCESFLYFRSKLMGESVMEGLNSRDVS